MKKIEIQQKENSYVNEESMYSIDTEVIESKTSGLFHQSARFLLIKKGKGKIKIQNKIYEIKDKSLVCILPWEYTEVIEVKKSIQYHILKYNFDSVNKIIKSFYNLDTENLSLINSIYEFPIVYCNDEQFLYFSNIFKSLILELGEDSIFHYNSNNYLSSAFVLNKIIDIVITYRRLQDDLNEKKENIAKENFDKINIFRYLSSHLSEKLTASLIAKLFFISAATVNRYIKETTSLSFNNLLTHMRIGKTMDMLLYTDLSIDEISKITGFTDASHLCKVFSSRVGKNPNKYRQSFNQILQMCKIENTRKFYKVLEFVVENSNENLEIVDLSKKFLISQLELNKLFLYFTEKNFISFLNFVRINKATKLLLETDKKIVDIAFEVGYNTVKSFNRNFLRFQKILPTEFRKNLKLQNKDI